MNLSTILSIAEKFKGKASLITTSISTIAAIGGGVIYIETNYAHAADVKDLVSGQQQIIRMQQVSQRQQLMFQLEYYDDRIKRLTAELAQAEAMNATTRSQTKIRPMAEIQSDLDDTKKRRELARQLLTTD